MGGLAAAAAALGERSSRPVRPTGVKLEIAEAVGRACHHEVSAEGAEADDRLFEIRTAGVETAGVAERLAEEVEGARRLVRRVTSAW